MARRFSTRDVAGVTPSASRCFWNSRDICWLVLVSRLVNSGAAHSDWGTSGDGLADNCGWFWVTAYWPWANTSGSPV
ncbi:hypothetical protein D3C78_1370870 [compost metagenome]